MFCSQSESSFLWLKEHKIFLPLDIPKVLFKLIRYFFSSDDEQHNVNKRPLFLYLDMFCSDNLVMESKLLLRLSKQLKKITTS